MATVEFSNNVRFHGTPVDSEWDGVAHVRYTGHPEPLQVQWGGNSNPQDALLVPGEVYELDRVEVHSWHTKLFLVGIDCGRGFNSVNFEAVQDGDSSGE
jgi:hypothetical protein